jgi:hypothetical protein
LKFDKRLTVLLVVAIHSYLALMKDYSHIRM